jgi:membrane protease YdiL (CAAX protease family)
MSFFAAAALTLGARLLAEVVVGVAEGVRPGAMHDIVTWGAAFAVSSLIFLFVIVRVWVPEESLRIVLALRPVAAVPCLLATIAGAAMYAPVARLNELAARRFPLSAEDQETMAKMLDTSTPASRLSLFIGAAIAIPLASEIFFRGAIYGRLRHERSESIAVFATTAYFVLANFDPRNMVAMLVLGATLTWLRARTGSTVPAMLAHAAFYAVPHGLPLFGRVVPEDADWSVRWVAGGALVSVFLIAVALVYASKSDACRTARAIDA